MTMMNEADYISKIIAADTDAKAYGYELKALNDEAMSFYNTDPWNEVEGHSTVVSTDVQDVVESDMPSMVRTFLSSKNVLEFQANTANPREVQEAKDKTALVNWVIQHQPDYFKLMHGWIKTAEIKKFAAVRYDWCEDEKVLERKYSGLSEAEAVKIKLEMLEDDGRDDTDITITKDETDDDGVNLEFKIKTTTKGVKIVAIPTDNFVISRNATSENDAEIVGDDELVSKSDLIALGFDKKTVMGLSPSGLRTTSTSMNDGVRNQYSDVDDPASELVVVSTRCVKIDRDGDGIAERRKVIYSDQTLLSDEPFDHVNYAVWSTILMPDEAVGKSRSEITVKTQEVKTALVRGMLDNTYRVNSGRTVVNTQNTNVDDVLTQRANGVIRTKGDVRQAVAALETPYVADKTLQVIQYMDFARAQRTGTLMASQGLSSDTLQEETATRFNGIQDEGAAKTELVMRVFAETGLKKLYEGIAWTLTHFQDSKMEIMVLGKEMEINPSMWRYEHGIVSNVGIGASDEEVLANMGNLLAISQQLKAAGSTLTDDVKIYNMLDRVVKSMGQRDTSLYFNNPEIPEQTLMAQYEQVLQFAEQAKLQLEQQNPLAQAEQVKAQASLLNTQIKEQSNQQKNELDLAKLIQDQNQFNAKLAEEQRQFNAETITKLNELELQFKQEITNKTPDV
jgi:hypothetical protein